MKKETRCRYCGESDCPRRHNVERQEAVVEALWNFARDIQTKPITIRSEDGTALNLESVGVALKRVMRTFNYGVVPIQ